MSWVNPLAMALFAPIAALIITMYLLRMRRRDVKVPATFLWPSRTEEIRANSLFQKLRWNWLMLIQLIAAFLICAALARPQLRQEGLIGRTTVIILDTSASMKATDVAPSRFEAAKQLLIQAINTAGRGDQLALIDASVNPRVVFPLSNDPSKQRQAVQKLEATDTEGRMDEALKLATAIVSSVPSSQILILSDGCFPAVQDFNPGKSSVLFQPIGIRQENVGIYALGGTPTSKGVQIFCGVRNYGLNRSQPIVDLYADGKRIHSTKLSIASQKSAGFDYVAPLGTQLIEAKIETADLLASDNQMAKIVSESSTIKTLLVSPGNPFLERALLLDPRCQLDRIERLANQTKTENYDLVIFDAVEPSPVSSKFVIEFGGRKVSSGSNRMTDVEIHPVLNGVELRSTYFEGQQKLPPEGLTIASTIQGPLVTITDRRIFRFGFNLLDSDLPLQVGFPILIANLLDEVSQEPTQKSLAIRTGATFSFRAEKPMTIKKPNGEQTTLQPTNGMVLVRDFDQIGKYELMSGVLRQTVYATLQSDSESKIATKGELSLGNLSVASNKVPFRMQDYWKLISIVILLVLGFEWVYYTRRS